MRFQQRSNTWCPQTNWISWNNLHVPTAQHQQDVALSKHSQATFFQTNLLFPFATTPFLPWRILDICIFFLHVWSKSLLKVPFLPPHSDIHFSCNSSWKSHRVRAAAPAREMYRNVHSGNHSKPYRHFPTTFSPFGLEKLQAWVTARLGRRNTPHDHKVVTSVYFAKKWVTSRTTEDQ